MKILLTGGHLTPALALIDYIQANFSDQIIFIGRKYSQTKIKQLSNENLELTKRNIDPFFIDAVRISDLSSLMFLYYLAKLIFSIASSFFIILKKKPDVIVSFGGYLALPVVIAGYLLQIPIITHEQTSTAGRANQIIAKMAKCVALSFESSKKYFDHPHQYLVGNPVREQLFIRQNKPHWLKNSANLPLLYITGGNQGSKVINQVVGELIQDLSSDWIIIHQCGNRTQEINYLAQLEKRKNDLPLDQKNNYNIKTWIDTKELGWIYQNANLVISRAGANSVAELLAFKIATIFIPLPYSYLDEQQKNAEYYLKENPGEIIDQSRLTAKLLKEKISNFKSAKKSKQVNKSQLSVQKLYQLIQKISHDQIE